MLWIIIAVIGYFFNALANILDKYILSAKIPKPSVYAFFVAIFSLFALIAAPFGMRILSFDMIVVSFVSGAFFIYGLVFFYYAVRENDISRVAPLMGALMAIGALVYDFVLRLRLNHWVVAPLNGHYESSIAFACLFVGGFLITFDIPFKTKDIMRGIRNTFIASVFLITSLILLKYVYSAEGFINGFIWSRIGLFLGGLSLCAIPIFRKEILENFHDTQQSKSEKSSAGIWFMLNKIIGSLGNVCVQYAISIGPLVVVQALSGVQYAFVFILAIPLSFRFPIFFQEKLYFNDWVQKIGALALIGIGIYFSAIGGTSLFI